MNDFEAAPYLHTILPSDPGKRSASIVTLIGIYQYIKMNE